MQIHRQSRPHLMAIIAIAGASCVYDLDKYGVFSDGGAGGGTSSTEASTSATMPSTTTEASTSSGGGTGGASSSTSSETSTSTGPACPGTQELCNGVCTDTKTDLANCGACEAVCGVSHGACSGGICNGPCGPVPKTGLQLCWDYGGMVSGTQYVGLAGGLADPSQGQQIDEVFVDPRYVSSTPGQGFVLYDLGMPASNWDIELRAGLHTMPGNSTLTGTWDCTTFSCAGEIYLYSNGVEIGSVVSDIATGALSEVPHYDPPYFKNVKVAAP